MPKARPKFDRAARYRFLREIFNHLINDDEVSIKNIFEEYQGHQLGFIVNQDDNLVLESRNYSESMVEWSFLDVALALKANRTALFLL